MSPFPNVSEAGGKTGFTLNGWASLNSEGPPGQVSEFQSASCWLHLFPDSDP